MGLYVRTLLIACDNPFHRCPKSQGPAENSYKYAPRGAEMHSVCLKQSSFTFPWPPTSGRSASAKQTQYLKTSSYLHRLPFSRQPNAHLQKSIDFTPQYLFYLCFIYSFILQTFTDHYFWACPWVWKCCEYKTR